MRKVNSFKQNIYLFANIHVLQVLSQSRNIIKVSIYLHTWLRIVGIRNTELFPFKIKIVREWDMISKAASELK